MKNLLICLCLVGLVGLVNCRTSDILKVKLSHGGTLIGRYLTSHSGNGIRAFMGIPYALPPINDLRFKPPVKAQSWIGEKTAVADSSICIQRDPFRRDTEIDGSEDCLYLNVYTPLEVGDVAIPVMVFFHGGGWQCGSGISMFYGPDYIMDHKIIYIGANFRLGPLGFLSTGQEDCPGNNGLKDQVMVLKWIQENIAAFGGDPKRVTVFGESAGGASATYHMMSNLSKGLFHQAISQSGTNLNAWAQPAHKGVAVKRATKIGKMFDCPTGDGNWAAMIKCLRKVSAADITSSFYSFFEWDTDPMIPFPPVVEPNLPGAFITKHPRDDYEPHGRSIPWITGITLDEGVMKSSGIYNNPELINDVNKNWDRALPISLYYDHHDLSIQKDITSKINDYYFKTPKLSADTLQNFTNVYTDGWMLAGMDEYLRIRLSSKKKSKIGTTYVYLFAQKGAASLSEIFKGGREKYYGVAHAEELQYLFPIGKSLFISAVPTEEDIKVRNTLTEMWVNFAWHGNPTPEKSTLTKWKPIKSIPLDYLRIGTKDHEGRPLIAMEKGLLDERADFWLNLKAHVPADTLLNIKKDEL